MRHGHRNISFNARRVRLAARAADSILRTPRRRFARRYAARLLAFGFVAIDLSLP
jgi:hypothetical protein